MTLRLHICCKGSQTVIKQIEATVSHSRTCFRILGSVNVSRMSFPSGASCRCWRRRKTWICSASSCRCSTASSCRPGIDFMNLLFERILLRTNFWPKFWTNLHPKSQIKVYTIILLWTTIWIFKYFKAMKSYHHKLKILLTFVLSVNYGRNWFIKSTPAVKQSRPCEGRWRSSTSGTSSWPRSWPKQT
jgi:hypothetical protein